MARTNTRLAAASGLWWYACFASLLLGLVLILAYGEWLYAGSCFLYSAIIAALLWWKT